MWKLPWQKSEKKITPESQPPVIEAPKEHEYADVYRYVWKCAGGHYMHTLKELVCPTCGRTEGFSKVVARPWEKMYSSCYSYGHAYGIRWEEAPDYKKLPTAEDLDSIAREPIAQVTATVSDPTGFSGETI